MVLNASSLGLGLALALCGACGGVDAGGTTSFGSGTTTASPAVDSSGGAEGATTCTPGEEQTCMCPDGGEGVQVCLDDGRDFEPCMCEGADGTGMMEETGEPAPCGNGTCDADEDCETCEIDCGVCESCTLAPSCDGAEIPPLIDTHADFLDNALIYVPPAEVFERLTTHVQQADEPTRVLAAALSAPQMDEAPVVGGIRQVLAAYPEVTTRLRQQLARVGMPDPEAYRLTFPEPSLTELSSRAADLEGSGVLVAEPEITLAPCDDPRIRIRVAQLTVHEDQDDLLDDEIYCIITSEAAVASELKITPITPPMNEGDVQVYNLEGGLVWGQAGLTSPEGNILMTYDCIESDNANVYQAILEQVADAANMAGGAGIPGVDGWIFPTIGVVADLLAGLISLDGDDLLFNAGQVVPNAELLPLTYGAYWNVRRSGTHNLSDWDWELRMEIWGCHDNAG